MRSELTNNRGTAAHVRHPGWLSVVSWDHLVKFVEQLAKDVTGDDRLAVRLWDTRLPGAEPAVPDYHVWMFFPELSEP